ncbi:ATP-binding protein [Clostridium tyrobutyricum]|uniref:ATP-binding protein n=1 Tax=Clostridium tyrobutyricum TaxID=1519 RepID=UPI000314F5AD|nr:ATP-binding protein [Clostridium tyrobutyricum]MEA5009685.1 ATP-binding protein [Clostridium tyrobutyricum]
MENILITTEGIQKNLRNIKPLDAICEYIWNGFDANATIVKLKLHINEMGLINMISIKDNGVGIVFEELKQKFQPFNDSKKAVGISRINHSIPHGKRGIGRLTFFAFAQTARWSTVYLKNKKRYKYFIKMNKDSINTYNDNDKRRPKETTDDIGTEVVFTQLITMAKEEIINRIKEEFFWFLELNSNNGYQIWVDEDKVTYKDFIGEKITIDMKDCKLTNVYDVQLIRWNKSLGREYSKIYFIGSDDKEKYKEATKLNKKSDDFFHSVFVKSRYFNEFNFEKIGSKGQLSIFPNKDNEEYKNLVNALNKYLLKYRKNYLKKVSNKYIDVLINKDVYPQFDTTDIIGNYKKQQLDNLVETLYTAQPKIFTSLNDDNKKITLHLLNLIMDNSNKSELFNVLKQVIELDEDEIKELSDILKYTSLNSITKTIKLVEDRIKVVQGLKELVFNKDLFAKEVPHIQDVVENHYWLFGEQYNLITAAEPDFELALMGLIKAQTGKNEKVSINNKDKNKEMDIYMLRQNVVGKVTENVVVELKRPTIALGEEQLSQVKRYMRVIKSDDRFNAVGNVKWIYYLVGNHFNSNGYMQGEIESHDNLGEQNLVHSEQKGNQRIYVLKWSDIFNGFTQKNKYLMDQLKLKQELWLRKHSSANEVVNDIKSNTATLAPPIVPKKKIVGINNSKS